MQAVNTCRPGARLLRSRTAAGAGSCRCCRRQGGEECQFERISRWPALGAAAQREPGLVDAAGGRAETRKQVTLGAG